MNTAELGRLARRFALKMHEDTGAAWPTIERVARRFDTTLSAIVVAVMDDPYAAIDGRRVVVSEEYPR